MASTRAEILELSKLRKFSQALYELSDKIEVSDGAVGGISNVGHRHSLLKVGYDKSGPVYLSQNLSTKSRYGFSVCIEKVATPNNYLLTGQLLPKNN